MVQSLKNVLGTLLIDEIIVHEVPRQTGGVRIPPKLSARPSSPNQQVKTFFEQKTQGVLRERGFDCEYDPASESLAPQRIEDFLGNTLDLTECSQQLAEALVDVQVGLISPGLLCVASCRLGTVPAIAIIKLEKDEGVQVKEDTKDGQTVLNIEHVRELMLTQKTRVFKAAVFARRGKRRTEALISDTQQPRSSTHGVALFFLESFLGCKLAERPEVTTKAFFATAARILGEIEDPEERANGLMALRTTLLSQEDTLNTEKFARAHLPKERRKEFMAALEEAGLPAGEHVKNISLLTSDLKHLRVSLESGIHITVPPGAEERMSIEEQESGESELKIVDTIKTIK